VVSATPLFEQAVAVQNIRFLSGRTIYSRVGDLVAWLSLTLTVAALVATRR
jgi:apolipoprotein N-acyltransferase